MLHLHIGGIQRGFQMLPVRRESEEKLICD